MSGEPTGHVVFARYLPLNTGPVLQVPKIMNVHTKSTAALQAKTWPTRSGNKCNENESKSSYRFGKIKHKDSLLKNFFEGSELWLGFLTQST